MSCAKNCDMFECFAAQRAKDCGNGSTCEIVGLHAECVADVQHACEEGESRCVDPQTLEKCTLGRLLRHACPSSAPCTEVIPHPTVALCQRPSETEEQSDAGAEGSAERP